MYNNVHLNIEISIANLEKSNTANNQLPGKCGSGGFRWASFRSGCFSVCQESNPQSPTVYSSVSLDRFLVMTNMLMPPGIYGV